MSMAVPNLLLIILISTFGAVALIRAMQFQRRVRSNWLSETLNENGLVFLFEGKELTDASDVATSMIAPFLPKMSELDAVLHLLSPVFPRIRIAMYDDQETSNEEIEDSNGKFLAKISRSGQRMKLTINRNDSCAKSATPCLDDDDIRLAELEMLRTIIQQTPQLIWKEDLNGNILWSNEAYLSFSDTFRKPTGNMRSWPQSSVFPSIRDSERPDGISAQRVSTSNKITNSEHWFDLLSIVQGTERINYATDASALVHAEQERRTFVQTVGKTFAQLSIGLAIFDKRRQLAMFNPALLDLTGLSAEFLSGRPSVDGMLDKLREARVLPEPKNYRSWRDEFTALEMKAKDGTYCEIWNLPNGQSYRVTGRPHPDGAFAILFEDISSEVTLTRRFRSDIETSQAVLDAISEPIAVFSNSGTLVMSNQAYSDLWSIENSSLLSQRDIRSEVQNWQNRCTPTLMWSEIVRFALASHDREFPSQPAILEDGRQILCHAELIANSMTMIRFSFPRQSTGDKARFAVVDAKLKSSNI